MRVVSLETPLLFEQIMGLLGMAEALCTFVQNMRMSAYGRKQTFGLSLNRRSLTSALEKKADIRVLELLAKANGRNRPKVADQLLA